MGGRVHVYGRGVGRCDSFAGGEGEGEGGVSLYRLRDMGAGWDCGEGFVYTNTLPLATLLQTP